MKRMAVALAMLLMAVDAPAGPDTRVTMNFRDTEVVDVLHVLSRECGVSLVLGGELTGKVSVNLVDQTFEEALQVILDTHGYRYYWEKGTVVVDSRRPVTRIIELNYVDARRIADALAEFVSEGGLIKAIEDPQTDGVTGTSFASRLIVVERESKIDELERLVHDLDVAPQQVVIEAKFVETSLGNDERLGIRWNVSATGSGATMPMTFPFDKNSAGNTRYSPEGHPGAADPSVPPEFPDDGFFPYAKAEDFVFGKLSASEFSAVLEALSSRRKTNLVSAPQVTTLSNQAAEILVGEQVPIALYERHRETGVMEIIGYEQQEVGIRLWVTPHVGDDGKILLEISPETSSIVEFIGQFNERPVTSARTARTRVIARDGETVVIGGLIQEITRDIETGVPFLKDIPLLGRLFKHTDKQVEKVDLMIFITPRVLS